MQFGMRAFDFAPQFSLIVSALFKLPVDAINSVRNLHETVPNLPV